MILIVKNTIINKKTEFLINPTLLRNFSDIL